MLKLGFLASHGGSNMQAIIYACKQGIIKASPEVVISNNSNSYALERGKNEGIASYHISKKIYGSDEAVDNAILDALIKHQVDIVCLAGYMKKIGVIILQHYKNKVLNIHPALLPKFGGQGMFGMNVHKAVIEAGEKVTGATIHLVDEIYDNGRILSQAEIFVLQEDTPESLAERVLKIEHVLYPETLRKIALGEIVLD